MKIDWKKELLTLKESVKSLDKKTSLILFSVALLQTLSWYLTSRQFFRDNFYYTYFASTPDADLYEFIYWFLGDFITFFLLPFLLIVTIFKENLSSYGVNFREWNLGIRIALFSFVLFIPILWFVSGSSSFASAYPLLESSKYDWNKFLLFQVFLLIFLFAWEFFWRGYMLFGLKARFGYYAIFIQMIPFVILHNGKPFLETSGAILGGLFLGVVAYRTGSFLYGYLIHYGVLFFIDFFAILRFRAEEPGTGIDSFFRILSKLF